MKKIICLIINCFFVTTISSQITTRENIVEITVNKPEKFDSLSNLKVQEKICDYKKYIGYQLYCLPFSNKYDYVNKTNFKVNKIYDESIGGYKQFFSSLDTIQLVIPHLSFYDSNPIFKLSFPDTTDKKQLEVFHKYSQGEDGYRYEKSFLIDTNILYPIYSEKLKRFYTNPDSISGHYFTILDFEILNRNKYYSLDSVNFNLGRAYYIRILLKNDITGDTIYWNTNSVLLDLEFASYMFLVPYFVKQQQLINKSFICMKDISQKIDVNTGELIDIHAGEKWTCTDVSFVNSKDYRFIHPYYFLKSDKNEITLDFGYFDDENFFIEEKKWFFLEAEKKKVEEQRIAEEKERVRIEKENRLKHEKNIITKYGVKIGTMINNGQVTIGMNKEMCREACGSPLYINTTIVKNFTHEQWVYNYGKYLYFDNGILTAIQK